MSEQNILSVEEIMDAADTSERVVEIPEWNGSVIVKSLSHRDMRSIKKSIAATHGIEDEDDIDEDELEKWITIRGLVQPKINEAIYEQMLDKSSGAMMKIVTSIFRSTKSEEKAITEAEKSVPVQSGGDVPVSTGGESGNHSGDPLDREGSTPLTL